MRTVIGSILGVVTALLVALVFQVLVAQSREQGDFGDRVAAVVDRALGVGPESAVSAQEPSGRGTDAAAADTSLQSVRIGDITAADLQMLVRESTREELNALHRKLLQEAERREADGFWTDVRLNGLFLFLGVLAPIVLGRAVR